MFTYLTNGKRSKAAQMAMAAMALSMLTSCHFGDIDDVRPKDYADVTRDFEVRLAAITPSGGEATRTTLTDLFTNGLLATWDSDESIALFSDQIQEGEPAIRLTGSGTDDEGTAFTPTYFSTFTGKGKLKVANSNITKPDKDGNIFWNWQNREEFYLAYPYDRFPAEETNNGQNTSVTLDFTGQDGTLETLGQNYQYAWGFTKGLAQGHVSFGTLDLVDDMGGKCNIPQGASYENAHKNHNQAQNNGVVLDNKMSVIRFCLVHTDENTKVVSSFDEYLSSKSGYQITKIILSEETADDDVLYNKASLTLNDGSVAGSGKGNIVIENPNGIELTDIPKTYDSNITPVLGNELSWGSAFYVAIPVPDATKVYDCHLEIHVTGNGITEDEVAGIYYANFRNRTFKEGNYYMTAPIDCSKREQASIENEIRIYLYHNSSLVYDVEDIKSETVLAKANGTNNAVGEKDMFENAQVGDILRIYFTRENGNTFESYNVQINNRFWDKLIFSELNNTNTINKDTEAGRQAADRGYFEFELTQERLDLLKKTDTQAGYTGEDVGMNIVHNNCHDVRVSLIKLN